ncbi:MAG: translation initiation factor IF-3 [Candidatus Stahlbacteria bacterium]|nr:translation initiation factor IF-3 [Candidatus Stahlbacteria bacterium]
MRPYPEKELRVNERIRFSKLKVIGADGKPIGVIPREEAIRMAKEMGLDLVEVVPTATPPICKIMDYGKYKYEKNRSEKHKRKPAEIKEIQLGMNTQEADIAVKLKWAKEFLEHGDKIVVKLRFRGREKIYANRGKEILLKFAKFLEEGGILEQEPLIEGNTAKILITPKKDAKSQNK